MSVYNNGPYVKEAIDSVLRQTFSDFEFLIIDDGSTDESAGIIDAAAAADPRVIAIHQPNKGFVASLNTLFEKARTPWIARMDGDDVCLPARLEQQLRWVDARPECGVSSCGAFKIDPSGHRLPNGSATKPTSHEGFIANLESGPLVNHNAALIRRDIVLQVGGYRAAFKHAEDYDLWLRLAPLTAFVNLPDELIAYRIYPGQVSQRHVVEQAVNASISWLAYQERQAGRLDPTDGLTELPRVEQLDDFFHRTGCADYVRKRVVNRVLYSVEALAQPDVQAMIAALARDGGMRDELWRVSARLARGGRLGKAAQVARHLLQ